MVNTRSGSRVDQPAVPRQRRSGSSGSAQQQRQMDPAMQQFLEAQTQLLQNMDNNMAAMQAQINQNQQQAPQQQPPRDKHREFMSHRPPVFTHAADLLEAEDWLKAVEKMLTVTQCTDREKVLYASGRLQGIASAWWDAYVAAHATPDAIT